MLTKSKEDILKRIKEIVDNEKITSIEVRLMIKDILEKVKDFFYS